MALGAWRSHHAPAQPLPQRHITALRERRQPLLLDGAETRRATEASTAEEDEGACVPADMLMYDSDGYYSDA